jgi:uncharacterized membrane protein YebE (DUF533 family)
MFNAGDLLGGLLQSGMRGSSMGRIEHAMGERGLGGAGGPLGQILSQLGGAGRSPHGTGGSAYPPASGSAYPGSGSPYGGTGGYQGGGGGDLLGGLAGLAERYLGGGGGRPGGGSSMAMGGLGALAAAILARRAGGSLGGGLGGGYSHAGGGKLRGAIGAGGLALLGMLAMRALQNAGRQTGSGPGAMNFAGGAGGASAGDPAAMLPEEAVSDRTAGLVLRAMIEAAKADGQIDATERQRILGKIQESGADQEEIAFLQQEMDRPADPDGLAAEVRDPAVAAQLYAASLLAITVDTPAEQAYLRGLAGRLGLEPAVTAQLHQALGAPAP